MLKIFNAFAQVFAATKRTLESGACLNRNDLLQGRCAAIIIIFARGTIELGNMGALVGVPLQDALNGVFEPGQVIFQGIK